MKRRRRDGVMGRRAGGAMESEEEEGTKGRVERKSESTEG